MQAGQQSKIPIYLVPTHVITIRYIIDLEYTRCDRIGQLRTTRVVRCNLVGTTTYVVRTGTSLRTTRVVRCNLVGTTAYVVRTGTSLRTTRV